MEIPPLPATLKKSEWQKHASIVAKVMPGKSSGISDALAKVESAHTAFKTAASTYDPKTLIKTAGVPKATREYAETIEKTSDTLGKALDKLIANLDHKVG